MKRQNMDNRILFSVLVYVESIVKKGSFDEKEFIDLVRENTVGHGHKRFQIPPQWKEELAYLIKKFGWRVFDVDKGKISPKGEFRDQEG